MRKIEEEKLKKQNLRELENSGGSSGGESKGYEEKK